MVKKRKRNRIDSFDTRIFSSLHKARRPLSLGALSKRTDISWPTMKKHVIKLEKFGVLNTKKTIRKTNVFIDPGFLKSIGKKKK